MRVLVRNVEASTFHWRRCSVWGSPIGAQLLDLHLLCTGRSDRPAPIVEG